MASFGTSGKTYEVGPGKTLTKLADVPWELLEPGDQVQIHARLEPYQEKFVLCRQGSAEAPIVVKGILGPNGERPIIDGSGATTRTNLRYWGDTRSVVKIGGATSPPDTMPRHLVLENLTIRGGVPPNTFTAADGSTKKYTRHAAGLYVEKVENLAIRNCVIHDNGNGLFISSDDNRASTNILVEGNYFHDNGLVKSGYEHNAYTAAIGITYQYNRFGLLKPGSYGNNLKDRSAGTVVRYNWFETGNNVLDLVEGEDSVLIRQHPGYRAAFVYGNVFIKPDRTLHGYVVHYGGDSTKFSLYRKGTLYFYNNTIYCDRKAGVSLLRLSSKDEQCDFRNNLVLATPRTSVAMVTEGGVVRMSHNWLPENWRKLAGSNIKAVVHDDSTSISGTPQVLNSGSGLFHLTSASPCRNTAATLPPEALPLHAVRQEYLLHQKGRPRPDDGKMDIGAFEWEHK